MSHQLLSYFGRPQRGREGGPQSRDISGKKLALGTWSGFIEARACTVPSTAERCSLRSMKSFAFFVLAWVVIIVGTLGVGLLLVPVYWLLVIKGSEGRALKAADKLQKTLMEGEHLVSTALQMRLLALTTRRQLVGLTGSRLIFINRSRFGGFTMRDYQWKDLTDVQLSENMLPNWFGSQLSFKANGSLVAIDGVRSDDAAEMYRHAQRQEQAWEEKRRVRELEELRASSGGTTVHAGHTPGVPSVGGPGALEELQKAKKLLDEGIVSDVEYQEIKAKILARGHF
jgi:hypothetical protein